MKMQVMGIAWDKFNSRLKAEVLKDLLKLKDPMPELMIEIQSPEKDYGWLKAIAEYTNTPIVKGRKPDTWRLYITEQEAELPEYARDIIRKDMRINLSRGIPLRPHVENYPTLDRQSDMRMVPPGMSISLDAKPPPRQQGNQPVTLPQNYWYSPFV